MAAHPHTPWLPTPGWNFQGFQYGGRHVYHRVCSSSPWLSCVLKIYVLPLISAHASCCLATQTVSVGDAQLLRHFPGRSSQRAGLQARAAVQDDDHGEQGHLSSESDGFGSRASSILLEFDVFRNGYSSHRTQWRFGRSDRINAMVVESSLVLSTTNGLRVFNDSPGPRDLCATVFEGALIWRCCVQHASDGAGGAD